MASEVTEHSNKRQRMEHEEVAIHCTDDTSELVSPRDVDSWKTLVSAAEIRKHAALVNMAITNPEGEIPRVWYHRKCRSIFTMKKLLNAQVPRMQDAGRSARPIRATPSTSRVLEEKCIFCEKTSKYITGQKTRDTLIKCSELRSDNRIREAAVKKVDDRMLSITSRELVAAEGHYHRSCYRSYTCGEPVVSSVLVDDAQNVHDVYKIAESQSIEELFSHIRNEQIPSQDIVLMTALRRRFEQSMSFHGVTEVTNSSRKNLRRTLEKELEGSIQICPDDTGKLLVYADSLSRSDLVKRTHALRVELDTMRAHSVKLVVKTAILLRSEIKRNGTNQTWPPDVEKDKDIVPESVSKFLQTLLTGKIAYSQPRDRVDRLTSSLGSDLVFAVTGGQTKPPKHIMLPFAVKSLTGNTELIRTLNRLGHGVSYSQVEEIDTALCLQKLERSQTGVALPSNIYHGIFSTLAWDNIDRLEETTSGEGTSHRVNGIAVQPRIIGPSPQRNTKSCEKTKKRSIPSSPSSVATYNADRRVGPSATVALDVNTDKQVQEARCKNFIWFLTQISNPEEDQTISSWTGFNILVRNDKIVVQDTVGYLPTIIAPATDMLTVNEVLTQTLNIMETLELKEIVCVFDQALYAKAAEITWKHDDKFKNIILRMGAFHTICNLLSTIGKRFQDAGLRDLCVEAGVIA